jgi:hypothetical protein
MADVQQQRAREYAVCTYALQANRDADGSQAIFDQALTNGLAAIVANEWPGDELDRKGRILSARDLLNVIENHKKPAGDGTIHLVPAGEAEWITLPFGDDPFPNFTRVDAGTLRDGLHETQSVRHARHEGDAQAAVSEQHLEALCDLGAHPALFTLNDEALDRAEAGLAAAVADEQDRATEYWLSLSGDERARRMSIDYREEYAWQRPDERCEVQQCPICWQESLVATEFDGYLDQIGIGTCVACGYRRSREMAEDEAMILELQRKVEESD